jgi:signal transduction histidine kinase
VIRVMDALAFVRDRLLLATRALEQGDESEACAELTQAVDRLREALDELRSVTA